MKRAESKETFVKKQLQILTGKIFQVDKAGLCFLKTDKNSYYRYDCYCDSLKLAVEYNGPMHYDANFKVNDWEKRKRSENNGISFVVITHLIPDKLILTYLYFRLIALDIGLLSKTLKIFYGVRWDARSFGACLAVGSRKYLNTPRNVSFRVSPAGADTNRTLRLSLIIEGKEGATILNFVGWLILPNETDNFDANAFHVPLFLFNGTKKLSKYLAHRLIDEFETANKFWKISSNASTVRCQRELDFPTTS